MTRANSFAIARFDRSVTLALLMFPVLAFTAIAVVLMERADWLGWTAGGSRCGDWARSSS